MVRAPQRVPNRRIAEIVEEKAEWIRTRQAQAISRPKAEAHQFASGEQFWYLGSVYPLLVTGGKADRLEFSAGQFKLSVGLAAGAQNTGGRISSGDPCGTHPLRDAAAKDKRRDAIAEGKGSSRVANTAGKDKPRDAIAEGKGGSRVANVAGRDVHFEEKAQALFTAWYRRQARQVMEERVALLARACGFSYRQVKITSAKTRWGSCSGRGTLSFPWRLVMAPLAAIDYVVVHELVHTVVKGHGPDFWGRVQALMPDYQQKVRWLKENGGRMEI